MRQSAIIGALLIVLGVTAWSYHGITYRIQEKVFQIGKVKAVEEKEKTVPLPPIVGSAAIIGGIVLLVMGKQI